MSSEQEVTSLIKGLYHALGDWQAFARCLDPGVTVWESDADRMLHSTAEVDALRTRRRACMTPATVPVSVAPEDLLVDAWGDSAVARYILRAVYPGADPDRCYRVSDVLRRGEQGWRIVHHHSEAMSPHDRAAAAPPPSSRPAGTPPAGR